MIAALALANGLALAALLIWVVPAGRSAAPVGPLPSSTPPVAATPQPTTRPGRWEPDPLDPCEWLAAEHLADAGLAGTVRFSGAQVLHFDLTVPVAPEQLADEAAQTIWLAFDVAAVLQASDQCERFERVLVEVLADGPQTRKFTAEVDTADLSALHSGLITQKLFIDRVRYETALLPPD